MEKFEIATTAEKAQLIMDMQINHNLPLDITVASMEGYNLHLIKIEFEEKDDKLIDWITDKIDY